VFLCLLEERLEADGLAGVFGALHHHVEHRQAEIAPELV
jgi:hypothetical protein